ncbi:MAG: amidohydrolase family protein [Thermodesulfobacteriota bacterium]
MSQNKHTVLRGATLIDGNGEILQDAVLVLQDSKISAVGKSQDVQMPQQAQVYDLQGRYIIPGLIDTHVHLDLHGMPDTVHESLVESKLRAIRSGIEMSNTLRAGITTVRNAGSTAYIDIAVKKAVQEGLIIGPSILACGKIICMISSGSDYFRDLYREADGVDENRRAAREQLKEGADFLKVMASGAIMNPGGVPGATQLDVDEIRAVVLEGAKVDKHTAAHAHGAQAIKNAVEAGVRTIEHGTLADEEALKMMRDRNVFLVSTLCSNYWMLHQDQKKNGLPNFMYEKAQEVSKIRKENLHRALDLGVRVVMGTDAGTPYNYHGKNTMELVQYVEEGLMSEMEALMASTKYAAQAIDLADEVGTLEPGKNADLLVLKQDPLKDMRSLLQLSNLQMVFKQGKPVEGKVDTTQWSTISPLALN